MGGKKVTSIEFIVFVAWCTLFSASMLFCFYVKQMIFFLVPALFRDKMYTNAYMICHYFQHFVFISFLFFLFPFRVYRCTYDIYKMCPCNMITLSVCVCCVVLHVPDSKQSFSFICLNWHCAYMHST